MEKIAEFVLVVHKGENRRGTFRTIPEGKWFNFDPENKWCRWCSVPVENLRLELAELWSEGFMTLLEVTVPAGRSSIRSLIEDLNRDQCVEGELTEAFQWMKDDVLLHPTDSEPAVIESLCVELGRTREKRSWNTKADQCAWLASLGIDRVRVMGVGELSLRKWKRNREY